MMRAPPSAAARPGRMRQWWLNRPVRSKGMIVVAAPLIALIAVSTASLTLQANERQERSVATTASTLTASAQQVLVDTLNAETGVRGYVATRDPAFLQPYNAALARFPRAQAALRAAAIAEGDSREERAVAATATTAMSGLGTLRALTSVGASITTLTPGFDDGKTTMDTLRRQAAALTQTSSAINLAPPPHI